MGVSTVSEILQRRTRTKTALASIALLGLTAWVFADRPSKPDDTAAKKAIQQVLDTQVPAWNKCDLKEFMAVYSQSPNLRFHSGANRTQGLHATPARYQ